MITQAIKRFLQSRRCAAGKHAFVHAGVIELGEVECVSCAFCNSFGWRQLGSDRVRGLTELF